MSADKVQKGLICSLMAALVQAAPKRLREVSLRFQPKMGDVPFTKDNEALL